MSICYRCSPDGHGIVPYISRIPQIEINVSWWLHLFFHGLNLICFLLIFLHANDHMTILWTFLTEKYPKLGVIFHFPEFEYICSTESRRVGTKETGVIICFYYRVRRKILVLNLSSMRFKFKTFHVQVNKNIIGL